MVREADKTDLKAHLRRAKQADQRVSRILDQMRGGTIVTGALMQELDVAIDEQIKVRLEKVKA